MAASLLVTQRLAAEIPVCNPVWNLTADYVQPCRDAGKGILTYVAEDGRNVLGVITPYGRIQEKTEVSDQCPSDVKQRADVACPPLRRARQ
jgi:hypothetical protein